MRETLDKEKEHMIGALRTKRTGCSREAKVFLLFQLTQLLLFQGREVKLSPGHFG